MSNFAFLKAEWPELHDAATKAEGLVYPDARAACFYTRRALELAVAWLYQHDRCRRWRHSSPIRTRSLQHCCRIRLHSMLLQEIRERAAA